MLSFAVTRPARGAAWSARALRCCAGSRPHRRGRPSRAVISGAFGSSRRGQCRGETNRIAVVMMPTKRAVATTTGRPDARNWPRRRPPSPRGVVVTGCDHARLGPLACVVLDRRVAVQDACRPGEPSHDSVMIRLARRRAETDAARELRRRVGSLGILVPGQQRDVVDQVVQANPNADRGWSMSPGRGGPGSCVEDR